MNEQEIRDKIHAELIKAGDERGIKAANTRRHSIQKGDLGDKRGAQLAMSHAWALRNQADGLYEAAHLVKGDR